MIVVDSSAWIDYFNGLPNPETERLDAGLGNEFIVAGNLILAEVLQGFERDDDYRKLRRQGITMRKTIDMLIGTYCILNRLPLLHRDRDFEPMARHLGLHVVQ